jgi:hypothetical protein
VCSCLFICCVTVRYLCLFVFVNVCYVTVGFYAFNVCCDRYVLFVFVFFCVKPWFCVCLYLFECRETSGGFVCLYCVKYGVCVCLCFFVLQLGVCVCMCLFMCCVKTGVLCYSVCCVTPGSLCIFVFVCVLCDS